MTAHPLLWTENTSLPCYQTAATLITLHTFSLLTVGALHLTHRAHQSTIHTLFIPSLTINMPINDLLQILIYLIAPLARGTANILPHGFIHHGALFTLPLVVADHDFIRWHWFILKPLASRTACFHRLVAAEIAFRCLDTIAVCFATEAYRLLAGVRVVAESTFPGISGWLGRVYLYLNNELGDVSAAPFIVIQVFETFLAASLEGYNLSICGALPHSFRFCFRRLYIFTVHAHVPCRCDLRNNIRHRCFNRRW